MALTCRLFGHALVSGFIIDTDSCVVIPVETCDRCSGGQRIDLQRLVEQQQYRAECLEADELDRSKVASARELLENGERNWDYLDGEEKFGTISEALHYLEEAT